MQKIKLYDEVKINPDSNYANSSFQQEGFGHLKLKKVGTVIKLYDDGTYLVEFIDEGIEKSNIYCNQDLIKI